MKWFLAFMLVIGLALMIWGTAISNGPGSADERVAGALPIMFGIGFILVGIVVAFGWLIIRA